NVVLGNAYGVVVGVVVDTHVGRVARRLGLTASDDPVKVEADLMAGLPPTAWLGFAHQVILHGRAICKAQRRLCPECSLHYGCSASPWPSPLDGAAAAAGHPAPWRRCWQACSSPWSSTGSTRASRRAACTGSTTPQTPCAS